MTATKLELERRLLEGEETIRALSELIDLLPSPQFSGLRIQWHNARARSDREGNAVLRDIVNEFRRTLHGLDFEDTKGELEDAQGRVAELEAELGDVESERDGAMSEAEACKDELEESQSDLRTVEYNLKVTEKELDKAEAELEDAKTALELAKDRIYELEDELRNTVQKGVDSAEN